MAGVTKIAYCTIASANYLARVDVFAQSLREVNPDACLYVLLCEYPETCRQVAEDTNLAIISPDQVCADWRQMAFYYDIIEYNTALKPFFIEYLLDLGYAGVLYFDPDIAFYAPTQALERLLEEQDVLLTPHAHLPVADDGCQPEMESYIRGGQFNLGFVGFSGRADARVALHWWQSVCVEKCIFDPSLRYFVDQFWAAIFPSFVEHCYVIRDAGHNVAYWNVFQRPVTCKDGQWFAGGSPLVFFHFSGLDMVDPTRVSRHQNRVTAPVGSELHSILADYVTRVKSSRLARYGSHPYSFATFQDGRVIDAGLRRNFLALSRTERLTFGDPFMPSKRIFGITRLNIDASRTELRMQYYLRKLSRFTRRAWTELRWKLRDQGVIITLRHMVRFIYRKFTGRL